MKAYTTPQAEKIEFDYSDQIVVASDCYSTIENRQVNRQCIDPDEWEFEKWYGLKG